MAFNVSYHSLNDQNIRHIYSDQKIRFVYRKSNAFKPLKEELPIPPLRLYPKRFFDYYPNYHIGIPRAPAFRGTDRSQVDRIVKRICKPIQCQKERRQDIPKSEQGNEDDEEGRRRRRRRNTEGEEEDEDGKEGDKGTKGEKDVAGGGGGGGGGDAYYDEEEERKMAVQRMKLMLERLQKPTQSSQKKKYNPDDHRKSKESESSIPKLPPIPSRS